METFHHDVNFPWWTKSCVGMFPHSRKMFIAVEKVQSFSEVFFNHFVENMFLFTLIPFPIEAYI